MHAKGERLSPPLVCTGALKCALRARARLKGSSGRRRRTSLIHGIILAGTSQSRRQCEGGDSPERPRFRESHSLRVFIVQSEDESQEEDNLAREEEGGL